MRPKTSKRLRITVVFVVAALVAVIAGSAVALADISTVTVSASGQVTWGGQGNGIDDNCDYTMTWVLTAGSHTISSPLLYVNFGSGYVSYGPSKTTPGATQFTTPGDPVTAAYATYNYTGSDPTPMLTISHCNIPDDVTTTTEVATTTTEEEVTTTTEEEVTTTTVARTTTTEAPTTTTEAQTTTTVGRTTTTVGEVTSTTAPRGSLRITKTIDGYNPGLTYTDFTVVITGPAPSSNQVFNGTFDQNGVIEVNDLEPGWYTVTEQALGYPWVITGNGPVYVEGGEGQTGVTIVNYGSTSTTAEIVTSTTAGGATSTTGGSETTQTTAKKATTTVMGYSSTTVFGWVAQPDDIQTGFGGTAGGNGALIVLILASTLLVSVLVASAVGIRAGVL